MGKQIVIMMMTSVGVQRCTVELLCVHVEVLTISYRQTYTRTIILLIGLLLLSY